MANPTTNYGFVLPTPTDLVTDLPADFDVALQGVDTTLKALNPSTTLGDIEYRSSTANTNTRLGIGTTGQVLSVVGGVPAWATSSSGSLTQLATGTLSGSAVNLTSISGIYKSLKLVITGFVPSTDNVSIRARLNNDTGTAYTDQPYNWALTQPFDQTFMTLTLGNDNVQNQGLIIWDIPEYANTTSWKLVNTWTMTVNATTTANVNYGQRWGMYNNTAAISEINLFPSSGNFSAGTYTLYGAN